MKAVNGLRVGATGAGTVAVAIAVIWCASGCFDPTFPDGKVSCQTNADCPPGLSCSNGLCFHPDQVDGDVIQSTGSGGAGAHDGGAGSGGAAGPGGASGHGGTAGATAGHAGGGNGGAAGHAATDGSVADSGCAANPCALGDHRCGTTGLQSCVTVGNCTTWSANLPCTGRKTCQGDAPTASCQCPTAPAGCTAAGATCVGGAQVTCAVDADSCIYAAATVTCPSTEPCGGKFPSAVCVCPALPSACTTGQPGTFCDGTNKAIVTCTLDSNKCLVAAAPVGCTQPCTGSAGAVTCGTCATPPVECTAAGTLCDSAGKLETCGSDLSTGCLTKTGDQACGSPQTCQGSLPGAACVCPTPPAVCMGQAGTACPSAGSTSVVTCAVVNGCLTTTATTTCPSPQTCSGSLPSAGCACPMVTACQSGSPGSYCDTSSGDLVTCTEDGNGCFAAATAACPSGLICGGSFPTSKCACPNVPNCPIAGTSCNSSTLVNCTQDSQGCFHEADTNCASSGLVCAMSGGGAACSCPGPTNGCGNAAGKSCTSDTSSLTCTATGAGCIQGAITTCTSGQYCWNSTSTCAAPTAIGYPTDLGTAGSKSTAFLIGQTITVTATSTIRSFGLIAAATGSMVSMGLYTQSAASLPSQLVAMAQTKAVSAPSGPTKNEYLASPALAGGTLTIAPGTYWIMAMYDVATSIEGAPGTGPLVTWAIVSQGFGPMPQSLAGAAGLGTQASQRAANYYLLVTQ